MVTLLSNQWIHYYYCNGVVAVIVMTVSVIQSLLPCYDACSLHAVAEYSSADATTVLVNYDVTMQCT